MTAVTGKVWIVAASRFADSPQQGWRELRDDCSEAMDAVKAGVHATRELEWIRGALQGEGLGHGALMGLRTDAQSLERRPRRVIFAPDARADARPPLEFDGPEEQILEQPQIRVDPRSAKGIWRRSCSSIVCTAT